jgi:two-component system LytT family sensor kinase
MSVETVSTSFLRFLDKKYRVVHHLLFWTFIFFDEILSFIGVTDQLGYPIEVFILLASLQVGVVYVNLYILMPFLLFKNYIWQYVLLTGVVAFTAAFIEWGTCEDCQLKLITFLLVQGLLYCFISGTAIGLKLLKVWIENQQKIKALESENLKSELTHLKSSVNPHFLFNTLNNIYVQAKTGKPETADSVLMLSDLLRYQLDDCSKDKVPLSQEIDYLRNYLDLDKIRKNDAKVDFKISGSPGGIMIPPLLLIPFVENAAKHGQAADGSSYIFLELEITEKKLSFYIENSRTKQPINDQNGLGLNNIKRRLDLLYPGKHELKIIDLKETYSVNLKITL